jgi:hypothetical protein
MDAGDWAKAFSIASKFARLGAQRAAILRAQSAILSPGFYTSLGKTPTQLSQPVKLPCARFEPIRSPAMARHRAELQLNLRCLPPLGNSGFSFHCVHGLRH